MKPRVRALTALVLAASAALAAAPEKSSVVRVATLLPSVEGALRDVDGVAVVAGVRSSFRAPERQDVIDLGSPHHPNVERDGDTVTFLVWSHDVGGVTTRDVELAARIDEVLSG